MIESDNHEFYQIPEERDPLIPRRWEVGKHLTCDQSKIFPGDLTIHIKNELNNNPGNEKERLIGEVKKDFTLLARLLEQDRNLKKVDHVSGVSSNPEILEKRFGFNRYEIPTLRKVKELYYKLVGEKTPRKDAPILEDLQIYEVSRSKFLELYLPKEDK